MGSKKVNQKQLKAKSNISLFLSLSLLLAPHGALAVIAFRYSPTTLLYYIFQIFSLNLSKPITRGGIKWCLCRSNSLGTSHSTQGRNDSSSSSTAGLHCTVLYSTIYRFATHRDRYFY